MKTEGFGIVTEIDIQGSKSEKVGIEYKKYTLLGACNPAFAYTALQAEEMIGTMLPCNIAIIEREGCDTEIAAIDPKATMRAVENNELQPLAEEVIGKLKKMIESIN